MIFRSEKMIYNGERYTDPACVLDTAERTVTVIDPVTFESKTTEFHTDYIKDHLGYVASHHPERLQRLVNEGKIIEYLNDFEAQMNFTYIDGFEALMADLHAHGVKTAVVTSSNQAKMASVYRRHPEFRSLFDTILTSEDFAESKPSPDCYLKAAARFGSSPSACVVFEDSFNGLKAGRAAGMAVVGLATTNPRDAIAPLSDIQITDYKGMSYERLLSLIR